MSLDLSEGTQAVAIDRLLMDGDVYESYSADILPKIRRPFEFAGRKWVAISLGPGPTARVREVEGRSLIGPVMELRPSPADRFYYDLAVSLFRRTR
jgi:hypothetical protein